MKAYLGLGSNLGDRFANLAGAVSRLRKAKGVLVGRISPVYETDPVGDPDQPKYLNAAVEVETELEPKNLLKLCLAIEREMGRVRREMWESRVIDIDVLLCGDEVVSTKDLIVPHPLFHEREFVLRPLSDIAPHIVHPVLDENIAELLAFVPESGVRKMEGMRLET